MINLELIQRTIEELERSDTTFSNCEKLADLYIIRDHLIEEVETESAELLPSYTRYCETKTRYQKREVGKDLMLDSFQSVVREIGDFLQILYSHTDTQEEREMISIILRRFSE